MKKLSLILLVLLAMFAISCDSGDIGVTSPDAGTGEDISKDEDPNIPQTDEQKFFAAVKGNICINNDTNEECVSFSADGTTCEDLLGGNTIFDFVEAESATKATYEFEYKFGDGSSSVSRLVFDLSGDGGTVYVYEDGKLIEEATLSFTFKK